MNDYIKRHLDDVNKATEHFRLEIGGLRTGRANPALVEGIQVEVYGARTPLIQVASITVPEARVIRIEPWDKSIIKDVEKGINEANLGIQAVVDGNIVRITIPQMTEENRRDLVKILKEKLETAKVTMRSIREDIREEIITAEKNKSLTEDDKFSYLKQLDEEIDKWNKKLIELAEAKEKEIMTI